MTTRLSFSACSRLLICAMLLCSSASFATGERTSAITLGMGRSGVANSRGIEAIGNNPANLVLPHTGKGVEYFPTIGRRSPLDTTSLVSKVAIDSSGPVYDTTTDAMGKLIGRVVDDLSGDGIMGVVVYIPGIYMSTTTNADGRYEIDNLRAGTYHLKISSDGYHDIWASSVGVGAHLQTKENFRLSTSKGLRDQAGEEYIVPNSFTGVRETPPDFTFALVPFGFSFGANFLSYGDYENYFTGVDSAGVRVSKYLTDADKNTILNAFPSGVGEIHTDFEFRLLGMTIHNDDFGDVAFTITDRATFDFYIPKDYMRFFFYGLDSLGSTYNLNGTAMNAWYIREYAVSYAHKIPIKILDDFAAGVTVKFVNGYGALITDHYNASFGNKVLPGGGYSLNENFDFAMFRSTTDNISESSASFSPLPSPAGQGIGVDLGISGEMFRGFRAGFSLTDLGSINWTENARERVIRTSLTVTNPTNQQQYDTVKQAFNGNEVPVSSFSTPLPTALRLGGAMQLDNLPFIGFFPGEMMLTFQYMQGFNHSPGNTTTPRFATGVEWRIIPFLPLRTGVSLGGEDGFNWAAGFGLDLHVLAINVGTESIGVLANPSTFHLLSLAVETVIRI